MRYHHTAISVRDVGISRRFYEQVFGLRYRTEAKSIEFEASFVQLEDEKGVILELFQHKGAQGTVTDALDFSSIGMKHLSFLVADIEAVVKKVLEMKGSMLRDIRAGKTVKKNAFVTDPDGIAIELVEM